MNCQFINTSFVARYLVDQGCIKAFCDFLGYSDPSILKVCLEGLVNVLKVGEAEKSLGACHANMMHR